MFVSSCNDATCIQWAWKPEEGTGISWIWSYRSLWDNWCPQWYQQMLLAPEPFHLSIPLFPHPFLVFAFFAPWLFDGNLFGGTLKLKMSFLGYVQSFNKPIRGSGSLFLHVSLFPSPSITLSLSFCMSVLMTFVSLFFFFWFSDILLFILSVCYCMLSVYQVLTTLTIVQIPS